MKKCLECGSKNIVCDHNLGEVMCRDCGLVLDDTLFENSPYLEEGRKCNAKHPYLIYAGSNYPEGRIVKRQWLISTKQKNILQARKKISWAASKFKLPDLVKAEANMLYKRAIESNLTVGRDNASTLYACIYAACILNQVPKTAEELTAYNSITKKKLLRSFNLLKKEVNINIGRVDPVDLIPRFSSRLKLEQQTITKAIEIAEAVKRTNQFAGKHPRTIASASIYLATKIKNDNRPQREIANASGVIEVTIRKRSRQIAEALKLDF